MSKKEKEIEEEIIKNYAKNCGFKECKSWSEINDCFNELMRKNNALMRDLHEDTSWYYIDFYDDYYDNYYNNYYEDNYDYNDNYFDEDYENTNKPSKYIKKDIVPEKYYNNYYYNCD